MPAASRVPFYLSAFPIARTLFIDWHAPDSWENYHRPSKWQRGTDVCGPKRQITFGRNLNFLFGDGGKISVCGRTRLTEGTLREILKKLFPLRIDHRCVSER